MHHSDSPLEKFATALRTPNIIAELSDGLIGDGAPFTSPFGTQKLLYADYVASGRALKQIEEFVMTEVLPFYANSHTEASYCGGHMTRLRREARAVIANICGADESFSTIFTGSGATAGLNRLVHLFGVPEAVREGLKPIVFIGPYEHHSNILPWRESGAEIVEIPEASTGGPDLAVLEKALMATGAQQLKIGAFSLVSNVTGIVTDADTVTALLKRYNVLSIWDCAGSGPYLPIDMSAGTAHEKDAVVVSPHKFLGGPGASGVMIVRKAAVLRKTPVFSGGGTVRFVSPWAHDYSEDIATREEAGTPNVVGDIRAALCFLVKQAISQDFMNMRHAELRQKALAVWRKNPNIEILGNPKATEVLPIFSMRIRDDKTGGYLHQQLFTRLLSDCYGIQARGGCACVGPYAHRLLDINEPASNEIRAAILNGQEVEKPGWTRLNLSVLLNDEKADRLIKAVDELAADPYPMVDFYRCDTATARFKPIQQVA